MMLNSAHKLFLVELGEISNNPMGFLTASGRYFYVIASSYDDAQKKVENLLNTGNEVRCMISSDGSLLNTTEIIKKISILTDEIVF